MSALDELWLWLQGRSSQTETGPDAPAARTQQQQQLQQEDPAGASRKARETQARLLRNARYRAGPWQMK